jgi:hypothetical protein
MYTAFSGVDVQCTAKSYPIGPAVNRIHFRRSSCMWCSRSIRSTTSVYMVELGIRPSEAPQLAVVSAPRVTDHHPTLTGPASHLGAPRYVAVLLCHGRVLR